MCACLLVYLCGCYQDLPGTVCDDMFNDTAAAVICKEMDFSCSTGWTRKSWEEIQKQYPIVLDDIECGSENISFRSVSKSLDREVVPLP